MRLSDGGAAGPNGRDNRSGRPAQQGPAPADEPEDSSGAHGSLMQRYRGRRDATTRRARPGR